MRGKREDTLSLRVQGYRVLEEMYNNGKGTSKHVDKVANDGKPNQNKIYSESTKRQYDRFWGYFCDAMKEDGYKANGHTPRNAEEAAGFLPRYIEILQDRDGSMPGTKMSASSVHVYVSAACKVLHVSQEELELPVRHCSEYTRSRGEAVRDKHFSEEKNADLITFCQSTGLRSRKELQQIRGNQLVAMPEGSRWEWGISVVGKGGRHRVAPVVGAPEEVKLVVDRMREAGAGKVWETVHNAADIHHYRAEYAARIYHELARDPRALEPSERYCCRGDDRKGNWYDREALRAVSEALGHNRVSVVAESYAYLF